MATKAGFQILHSFHPLFVPSLWVNVRLKPGQIKSWLVGWLAGWLLPIYFNTTRKTIIMHYEEYVTGSIPPLPILIVTRATSKITRRQYKNCHRQNFNSLVKCNFKISQSRWSLQRKESNFNGFTVWCQSAKIIEFRSKKN